MPKRAESRVLIVPVDGPINPESVAAVTAIRNDPAILETLQNASIGGRFSIFAADPVEVFTGCDPDESVLQDFATRVTNFPHVDCPTPLPFGGGWIGFFGYESLIPKSLVAPRPAMVTPQIRFGLYDHALIFDHETASWFAVAVDWGDKLPQQSTASERLDVLHLRIELARQISVEAHFPIHSQIISEAFTPEQYRANVTRIQKYIAAGDIYQANLAQHFTIKTDAPSFEVYRKLREKNPASFAAFLSWNDAAILSASPELFLQLRSGHVVTRPIKGTRPRLGSESIDATSRAELAASEKEQAELNMIIDLLRNDLGRVCKYGSVRVLSTGDIEAHPTVYHRVATIEGMLAYGRCWCDLLRAAFPGGSIVGAPKIRAMQIIRELEPFARGPYCGAIGWVGLDGNMTLNIAIRTMVWRGGRVDLAAGGAIVADSNPQAEYAEIQAKARGVMASLEITERPGDVLREKVGAL